MNDVEQIIAGYEIFKKYGNGNAGWLSAEHDEIFGGPDPETVSEEDRAALEEIGWHVSYHGGSFQMYV